MGAAEAAPFLKNNIYKLLFLCILLYLNCESCSDAEGVFEDGCFGKTYVLIPTIVEFLKHLFWLVGEGFLQVPVMSCHVTEEFFRLL